ncbi:MAG TPA: glucose-6-phosphate isomerase [Methyloceanibacter sp.]|nr:glucose-6-phosphate isomerase [Methyloceanibacter sp.]
MALSQSVEGCLEAKIGEAGLAQAALDRTLSRLQPRLDSLREDYTSGALPLLHVPERRDDIEAARAAVAALTKDARTLVFFGTGGSSLGGQTLAQLGGWGIPGDDGNGGQRDRPRTRFYDNLDPRTLDRALSSLDLGTTRFVIISKSGNTPETLVQAIAAIEAVRAAGLDARIPALFLGLTEPRSKATNGLRDLCEALSIPTLPHDPNIGGRFSALTNVGLLPALARGLDVEALRDGAGSVVSALLGARTPLDFAPAVGAAVAIGLAKERGVKVSVMLPYSDRLSRFAAWYVQLWGESLGKQGEGTTPVAALGPVDQHSQLQLYLDGARTTVMKCCGSGPRVSADLAKIAHAEYLSGHAAGDLVAAQQKAIPEALLAAGRPVRTIDFERLDERALGALMMHFMLETILAGHLLGVDPFDQPAVESGKVITRRYLGA